MSEPGDAMDASSGGRFLHAVHGYVSARLDLTDNLIVLTFGARHAVLRRAVD